ncbi:hypothetical protein lerEdw1_015803, partial [Lerista edwardsae]
SLIYLKYFAFQPRRQWLQSHRQININHYANKKSAAESMLDIALLMANASQLKAVMEQGPSFSFYVPLIVLISVSLVLQIAVGVLLIFLGMYSDLNHCRWMHSKCVSMFSRDKRHPFHCFIFPPPAVKYDLNNPAKHAKLDYLNNLATGLVFVIVVVNIFITAFGVQKPSAARE